MNGNLRESDFGQRLELVRRWLGMNQEQAGELLGISKGTIGSWESLHREPSVKTVREIAEKLNVPFLWLCGYGPTFAFEVREILTESKGFDGKIE